MSEHFITHLDIQEVRHLHDIAIPLSKDKRYHLILTGKNGAGKTSVLERLRDYLKTYSTYEDKNQYDTYLNYFQEALQASGNQEPDHEDIQATKNCLYNLGGGIQADIPNIDELRMLCNKGKFIIAYYPANRIFALDMPKGPESIHLETYYAPEEGPSRLFVKYLVDLKIQQAFARNEGDEDVVANIKAWFDRLTDIIKEILDDDEAELVFDYRYYSMKIRQSDREYALNELSDGYSSVLNIVSDLILRMDKKRALNERNYAYDVEGIVLIDEIETHLHVELQKTILPFLTKVFPKIQFIVTTHSPFILTSMEDTIVYDLEKKLLIEDMSEYSYEGVIEGYFEVDQYSNEIKKKLKEYKMLVNKENCSDEDRIRKSQLRLELSEVSGDVAREVKAEFMRIETQRKAKDD